ncbi:polysaccharide deacetylase family protein [Virgibacillus sp. DJP39]|uniref:polysaccharide deacetylase family protein n=1 Tax=Virgibacillus sp. DJP39 TaxID=3409790 RepID=UPI003BB70710
MKKIIFVCLLLFIVLLSACSEKKESVTVNGEENNVGTEPELTPEQEDQGSKDKEEEKEKKKELEPVTVEPVEPKYKVNQQNWLVQPLEKSTNEKVVLLTIDDAPDEHAVEMAKTLKALDAGAIFFVNGHFLDTPEEKEALKKIHEMGFIIGNHTYNHPFLPDLSKEEQKEEIVSINNLVEEIIGQRPLFFRAPNGANTDYSKQIVQEQGMVLMNWSYGYDYFKPYMNAKKLTKAMVTGKAPEIDIPYSLLKPGANLLMHDREWTANALHDIVVGLRNQGYEIVDPNLIKIN